MLNLQKFMPKKAKKCGKSTLFLRFITHARVYVGERSFVKVLRSKAQDDTPLSFVSVDPRSADLEESRLVILGADLEESHKHLITRAKKQRQK